MPGPIESKICVALVGISAAGCVQLLGLDERTITAASDVANVGFAIGAVGLAVGVVLIVTGHPPTQTASSPLGTSMRWAF